MLYVRQVHWIQQTLALKLPLTRLLQMLLPWNLRMCTTWVLKMDAHEVLLAHAGSQLSHFRRPHNQIHLRIILSLFHCFLLNYDLFIPYWRWSSVYLMPVLVGRLVVDLVVVLERLFSSSVTVGGGRCCRRTCAGGSWS